MTAAIPTPGLARREAEARVAVFERLGFRNVHIGLADSRRHHGIEDGAVIVSGRAPCGRMLRSALGGPVPRCGARCECVEAE